MNTQKQIAVIINALAILVTLVGVMVYVCSGYLRLQKKIKN